MNITKQRAFPTIPNKNICVPIGSILAVQLFYEKLNFCDIFSKHKSKGLDLNNLVIGLLSYKLTENFSIKEAGKWLNQEEILSSSQNQVIPTIIKSFRTIFGMPTQLVILNSILRSVTLSFGICSVSILCPAVDNIYAYFTHGFWKQGKSSTHI